LNAWARISLIAGGWLAASTPVRAELPETTEGLLVAALEANAAGQCPASLMAFVLQSECERNLPTLSALLKRLGPIQSVDFQGTDSLPNGPAEVFKVTFANGDMTFIINTQDDGRAMSLVSPDPPHWRK
jgi:hypothetical protein